VNPVAARIARQTGSGWIDIEAEFMNRLQSTPRDDLFVADGHLNDRGYAIVARLVSDDVKYRLAGAPPPPRPKPGWIFDVRGAGNAARLASHGDTQVFKVEIQRCGTTALWDIQLRQPKLALKQGTTYEVIFRGRARETRKIAFGVNTHDYHNLGLFEEVTLGPTWREVRQSFIPISTDLAAELHFDVGAGLTPVELTNVVLRRLPDGAVVEPGAPL
jgi:hypothetical protein